MKKVKNTLTAVAVSIFYNRRVVLLIITWTLAVLCAVSLFANVARDKARAKETDTSFKSLAVIGSAPTGDGIDDDVDTDPYITYEMPYNKDYTGKKCYEHYTAITDKTSTQYALQQTATTDGDGFRKIDNRYLVSIGTHFNAPCGTVIDIALENGTVIPCIVGDIKPDSCTDSSNTYTRNNSATEFIVDGKAINAVTGDVSELYTDWQSKVSEIRVYTA